MNNEINIEPSENNPQKISEAEAQAKLLEILEKQPLIPPKLVCRSTVTEHTASYESNFAIYKIIAPLLENSQILELFCGYNTAKRYMEKNHIQGHAIGVDIEDKDADILHDVSTLPDVLPPKGQFNIVTSFGGKIEAESMKTNADYLKENGLYMYACSDDWYEGVVKKDIELYLSGQAEKALNPKICELAQFFTPIALLRINGIKNVINWDKDDIREFFGDMIVLICQKKKKI